MKMENMYFVFSILIGLLLFLAPMVLGIIRCTKYIFGGPVNVSHQDAYSLQYESILDVAESHVVVKDKVKKWDYAEIVCLGIAPVMGIIVSYIFSDMRIPFDPFYAISAVTFIAIGYTSYWASRSFRRQLPLTINLLLPYGILIGVICYLFLFIHFISLLTVMAMAFVSLLAFPLLAPLPAAFYAIRQFKIQRQFIKEQTNRDDTLPFWVRGLNWNFNVMNFIYLIGIILLIQTGLFFIGQPIDGFWMAFRGSDGFLFSINGFDF